MALLSNDDSPTHPFAIDPISAPRSHLAAFAASVAALLLVVLLSAYGGAGATGNAEPTQPSGQEQDPAQETAAADLTFATAETTDEEVCEGGQLTIGEFAAVETVWQAQRDAFAEQAAAWQADAHLTQLSVLCWFDADPEITATYYSPTTDGYFTVPDGEEWAMGLGETALDPAVVSFTKLREWLVAAGYDESVVTAGVDLSSTRGILDVPGDRFYYHVSLIASTGDGATSLVIDAESGVVEEAAEPGSSTPDATAAS